MSSESKTFDLTNINEKGRYWTFDCYDDSFLKCDISALDYFDSMAARGFVFAVAYHDLDSRKPHYHVILHFDGPVTRRYVYHHWSLALDNRCNCSNVAVVGNIKSMNRYLCHLDTPEKHQYNLDIVRLYGGYNFDISYDEDSSPGNSVVSILALHDALSNYLSTNASVRDVSRVLLCPDDWIDRLKPFNFLLRKSDCSSMLDMLSKRAYFFRLVF